MSNRLEDLEVYNLSEQFGDEIWFIVAGWEYFVKDTVGNQLVRAADSIGANIAEGFGRYHYLEDIITRRIKISATLAEDRSSKQKAG
jgi:four helix bundle protein